MRRTSWFILIAVTGGFVVSVGGGVVLFSENHRLRSHVRNTNELFQKLQEEAGRLDAEKAQIARDHETLQKDVVSYVAFNTTLQEETEQLRSRLTQSEALLEEQETQRQQLQDQVEKLRKQLARTKIEQRKALTQEINDLTQKVKALEAGRQQEQSRYQYNLGVVYAQVQRYDEAIEAYQKSLDLNPNNADAHYNLGLLYERVKGEPDKAVWHYGKYLESNPHAEDRGEVQGVIDRLMAEAR